jgi:hypothetical protein
MQRELEGTWRHHLRRASSSLSRRELVLQEAEALARQMDVLCSDTLVSADV